MAEFTLADLSVDIAGLLGDLEYAAGQAGIQAARGKTLAEAMPLFRRELREAHEALGRMLDRIADAEAAAMPALAAE